MTTAADLSPAAVEACIELVREQRHGVSFPELRTVCDDLGVLTAGDAILGAAAIPGVVLWAENVRRVRRDRRCRPRAHLDWARRLPAPGPRRRGGVHPDAVAAYPRASWPPNPSGYRTPHYPPVAFAWRQPLPRRTEADRLHIPTERTSTVTDEPTADRARRLYDQIGWPMANEVFNRVAGDVPPGPIAIPPQPGKPPRFWPLGEGRIVTSPFGPRDGSFHAGTDFGRAGGSAGMPVYACQGGTVIYAGEATAGPIRLDGW